MRPEGQLQSIQYGGSSFLLDIPQLLFVLCFYDIYPYQQNLPERCFGWQNTPSYLYFAQSRRHSSSDQLSKPSRLDHFLYSLMRTSMAAFTHPRTTRSLQTGPPAQYIYRHTYNQAYHSYKFNSKKQLKTNLLIVKSNIIKNKKLS